eukprot:156706_1
MTQKLTCVSKVKAIMSCTRGKKHINKRKRKLETSTLYHNAPAAKKRKITHQESSIAKKDANHNHNYKSNTNLTTAHRFHSKPMHRYPSYNVMYMVFHVTRKQMREIIHTKSITHTTALASGVNYIGIIINITDFTVASVTMVSSSDGLKPIYFGDISASNALHLIDSLTGIPAILCKDRIIDDDAGRGIVQLMQAHVERREYMGNVSLKKSCVWNNIIINNTFKVFADYFVSHYCEKRKMEAMSDVPMEQTDNTMEQTDVQKQKCGCPSTVQSRLRPCHYPSSRSTVRMPIYQYHDYDQPQHSQRSPYQHYPPTFDDMLNTYTNSH